MRYRGWLVLFGGILVVSLGSLASGAPGEGSGKPDDPQFLRGRLMYFRSLPASRQQQLQILDREFLALDDETQQRLRKVLERYQTWLLQLPEADRRKVIEAPTMEDRLAILKRMREKDWVETLPKADREKYAAAKNNRADQIDLVEKWRVIQRERRQEWEFVRANWDDLHQERIPPMFQPFEFRDQLDKFAQRMESQLPQPAREHLRRLREPGMGEERNWLWFGKTLLELSDRYPLLPGPEDGPRSFDTLPLAIKDQLVREDPKVFGKKKLLLPKEMQNTLGQWPAFAIALTEYVRSQPGKMTPLPPFGPTRKNELPDDAKLFVTKTLEPTLSRAAQDKGKGGEQARKDQQRLVHAEGKWPEYPRTVMELAKQYRLEVPGWSLPTPKGKNDVWERIRKTLSGKRDK